MTKTLDEIEADLTRTDHDTWTILYGHLLIRAVSQLGAVVSATEEFPLDLVRRKALDAVDPDVLALLEEGRSAE